MVNTRIIDSEPALILENDKKNLVISDLHIGFEHKFSSNKIPSSKNSSVNDIITNVKKNYKKRKSRHVDFIGRCEIKHTKYNKIRME